jgi:tetrahydromethanopterin S-methyltransferase subunit B
MFGKIAGVMLVIASILTIVLIFGVNIPANIQYNQAFGSDVTMATQGATTLTGQDSIQFYVNNIWAKMNTTFNTNNFANIYNSPWPWGQLPENSMAKQNSYLNSLNNSITQRQKMVETAIEKGNYLVDPVQSAINQTRSEMNSYGGLDWVLHDAWYLQNAPTAYWSLLYIVIAWVIFAILAFIAFMEAA